jgi:hypothetical protein
MASRAALFAVSYYYTFVCSQGQLQFLLPWLLYACLSIILSFIQHVAFAVTNFNQGHFAVGIAFVVVLLIHESKLLVPND